MGHRKAWAKSKVVLLLKQKFGFAKLLLDNVCFNFEIRQLIPETLIFNTQGFPFLLSVFYLFLEQNAPFYGNVVF